MRSPFLAFSVALLALLGFLFLLPVLGRGWLADPPQPNRPIIFNTDDPLSVTQPENSVTASSTGVVEPPVKIGEIPSASRNVVVTSLVPRQELANPFVILGRSVAFENTVLWRVKDSRGTVIASGNVTTDAPDAGQFGSFRVRAFYNRLPGSDDGTVEVFTRSPRDGAERDMVRVPVTLITATVPLKAYFLDVFEDPDLKNCDQPVAVTRRMPHTQNTAEAALLELLKGPSTAEENQGFRTAMIPGTELRSVVIADGTATVDFSSNFARSIAGSCTVLALRSQVEQTLKQFKGVNNVNILVEGADASQVLQP